MKMHIFNDTDGETERLRHLKTSNATPNHMQQFNKDCDYTNHKKQKVYLGHKCDVTVRNLNESERSN